MKGEPVLGIISKLCLIIAQILQHGEPDWLTKSLTKIYSSGKALH